MSAALRQPADGEARAFKFAEDLSIEYRELGPDGKPLGAAQPDARALPKELALDLGGGVKMEFVLIPAGDFEMGSNDKDASPHERPVHAVKITRPFYMAKCEVTQEEYEAVMKYNPSAAKAPKNTAIHA